MSIDEHWLAVVLEEYKSLRTESLTAMANQQATLRFGTAALGAIIVGLAVKAPAEARFWAFLFLMPLLSLVFFALYAIEFGRMVRVGWYISELEKAINDKFPIDNKNPHPLGWETWLNTPQEKAINSEFPEDKKPSEWASVFADKKYKGKFRFPRLRFYLAIPIIFFLTTAFSLFLAFVFQNDVSLNWQIKWLMIVVMLIFATCTIYYIGSNLQKLQSDYIDFPYRLSGKSNLYRRTNPIAIPNPKS